MTKAKVSAVAQRTVSACWPIVLIGMVIVFPFLVRKSYQELKVGMTESHDGKTSDRSFRV